MSTKLCDCVYAKARRLYEKFHENRGEVPADYDSLADDERDVWAKTVAGKGNYVSALVPVVVRKSRKPATETQLVVGDGQATSFKPPDWDKMAKEQRQTLARMEAATKAAAKAATKTAEREAKQLLKGKSKPLLQ